MNRDAVSLLKQLLVKEPSSRLGSGIDDADPIKRHPFFKDVNWDDVLNLRIRPPYFPKVSGLTDISNFDSEFTREIPVLTPCHSVLSMAQQEEFRGFTHISQWAASAKNRVS